MTELLRGHDEVTTVVKPLLTDKLFTGIRWARKAADLVRVCNQHSIAAAEVNGFLADEDNKHRLLTEALNDPEVNQYTIALLAATYGFDTLPDSLREFLDPTMIPDASHTAYAFHYAAFYNDFLLCGQAEERLKDMIDKQTVVVMNPYLVGKNKGKPAAFCTQSFITSHSTFVAGCFYVPMGSTMLNQKAAYRDGVGRLALQSGEFLVARPMYKSGQDTGLLQAARHALETQPAQMPSSAAQRSQYTLA